MEGREAPYPVSKSEKAKIWGSTDGRGALCLDGGGKYGAGESGRDSDEDGDRLHGGVIRV